jgi:hypothetical protein
MKRKRTNRADSTLAMGSKESCRERLYPHLPVNPFMAMLDCCHGFLAEHEHASIPEATGFRSHFALGSHGYLA